MHRLSRSFFENETPTVARQLLGKSLVRMIGAERLSGMIVEVEAYRGSDDPASHAYRGKTARNEVMFGAAGHSYVYFTYGAHYCLNVTTEAVGNPGAVLIRALEPIRGIKLMMKNRGIDDVTNITNGPGKLTQALKIDGSLNGEDLVTSKVLYLTEGVESLAVKVSRRIGISRGVERKWRFYADDNPFVSKAKPPDSTGDESITTTPGEAPAHGVVG